MQLSSSRLKVIVYLKFISFRLPAADPASSKRRCYRWFHHWLGFQPVQPSLCPSHLSGSPTRWTQVVAVIQIFKARERRPRCRRPKPCGFSIAKLLTARCFRVVQRTPDPLTVTGMNRQAVGIVQFRTEVGRR